MRIHNWVFSYIVWGLLSACGNRLSLSDPGIHLPPPPPPPLPSDHPTIGLVSAAVDDHRLRVHWRAHAGVQDLPALALFVATDPAAVFSAQPRMLNPAAGSAIVSGLASHREYFVGLGLRESPSDSFTQSGPILLVTTGAPVYVDPLASSSGDGLTPATAFNDITLGVLTAFVSGGGNVWIAGGEFANQSIPLFTGVHLYGGFAHDFLLGRRDPVGNPTRLLGFANQPIVTVQNLSNQTAVLDGFQLLGLDQAESGVSSFGKRIEMRSLTIDHCSRGVKLRSTATTPPIPILMTGVAVRSSALEGLSVDGPFDITIESSLFELNLNEGADFNHLVAPELTTVALRVRGSSFNRNFKEGLDCHLGVPLGAAHNGGHFDVSIEDCDFELNALDGARIDIDYDFFPEWSSTIVVRGSRTRANGEAGLHYDLDSQSSAIVQRLASSANRTDGFLLTSETFAGMCTLSASALLGNQEYGARASIGNYGLVASHCVFAGNFLGGCTSEHVGAIVLSSVAYRQASPWSGVIVQRDVSQSAADPDLFLRAPREFGKIVGFDALGAIVQVLPETGAGLPVEVQDDGVLRLSTSIIGTSLGLDPAAESFAVPGVAAFFDSGDSVVEDWRLGPSSIATGAGLGAPFGAPVDAGIFGSPSGGLPGREDVVPARLFRVASTSPDWTLGLGAQATLVLSFEDGAPEPASVPSGVFLVDVSGAPVPITPFVIGETLEVPAPSGGWIGGQVLELFPALRSTAGDPLRISLALPIRVP